MKTTPPEERVRAVGRLEGTDLSFEPLVSTRNRLQRARCHAPLPTAPPPVVVPGHVLQMIAD